MSSSQTIFLNGRRYDALTGKMVSDSDDHPSPRHRQIISPRNVVRPSYNRTVDGFIRSVPAKILTPKDTQTPKLSTAKQHAEHKVAPHINRKTDHSKTLMRHAVKKPYISGVKSHKQVAKAHIDHAVAKTAAVAAPVREAVVDQARAIKNSELASKLNELTTPANPIVPDPQAIQTTANSEVHLKNLDQLSQLDANGIDIEAIFSEASLKLSDSHQPISRKETRFYDYIADRLKISVKLLFIISLTLFILIFGVVSDIVFSNNIAMYISNSRTGLHGILPTYAPTGYSVQSIKYALAKPTGTISITYKGNHGGFYEVTEQSAAWDSSELVSKVVIPAVGNDFKTYQIGGRSVYIYQQTAVWVDADVFYQLTNNAGISNNQITRIVNTT